MESLREDPSKLVGVCRGCLTPAANSKCLLDDDEETRELITKFEAVAQLEVIINNQLPSFLCDDCEEKTNEAYKFRETCKQSDSFVKSLLNIKESTKKSRKKNVKREILDESFVTCKICKKVYANAKFLEKHILTHKQGKRKSQMTKIVKWESDSDSNNFIDEPEFVPEDIKIENESSDDEDYKPEKSKKPKVASQIHKMKLTAHGIRLKQFAKDNVDSVIENVKNRFEGSKDCRLCVFTAVNSRSLSQHMAMVHKEMKATWCWMCNENVDNLEEHNSISHVKDFECPFCQRLSKNITQFIEHLSRHSVVRYYKCTPCGISFEKSDMLKEHNFEVHPRETESYSRLEKELKLKKRLKIGLSRNSRVEQFPPDKVEAVIKRAQIRMNAQADCPVCAFNAVNTRALSTHMSLAHKEEKSKWCYFCNKLNIDCLKQHKEQMHSKEYECEFCGKNHKNVTNYVEHLMRHSESKNFQCTVCNKTFINEKYLEKHKKLHDEVQSLVEDVLSSDDEKRLSDLVPKKSVEQADQELLRNVKVEIGENQVMDDTGTTAIENQPDDKKCLNSKYCRECKKNVQNLEKHRKKYHTPGDPEPTQLCTICGKMLKNRSKLNTHLRLHSGIQPFKCQFCPKAFLMNSHLKLHIRTHTKEKPYICQVCGKSFAQTSMLGTHMRIHTGRPHQCNICEQRFCRPSELRIHMRKHTGEKPYICDQCGKGFKQTSHLVDHRRTHFDERPYQCSYCDKAFKNVATLKAHEFIHTGTKPFKCSKCPFTCRVSYHLTKHMMTHDGDRPMSDKPYSCEICTKNFQTKAHLFSHFDRYHNSSQNQQLQEEVVITETIPEDEKMGTDVAFYA